MNFEQFFIDISQLLSELKESFLMFFPKFVFALLIIFFGYLVAKLVQKIINRLFMRTISLITNKKVARHLSSEHIEHVSIILSKVLFWLILIFFITIASESVGLPVLTAWLSGIVKYVPNIVAALVIIVVGIISGRVIADLITSAMVKAGIFYSTALSKIIQYAIFLISLLIAVNQIGIDIAIFTTILSILLMGLLFAAALSFGLGAKTSVSNIIASYYVASHYKVDDYIQIDNIKGKILKITSTAVIIDTEESVVLIPAKEFNESKSLSIKRENNE